MFHSQFGLDRPQFFHVLRVIEPMLSVDKARATAAYRTEVCCELRLAIMLRMLRGASYLDMDYSKRLQRVAADDGVHGRGDNSS